jgi:hypothetical protein
MDNKWVFDRDFDTISDEIKEFECPGISLEIKPITIRADRMLFGCYIPAMPRMTSIISGKVQVTRLAAIRTEIQVFDFQSWVEPYIKSLIEYISAGE